MFDLMLWAVTLPLMPYVLVRRHYDLFCGLLLLFLFTSISVMAQIEVPNPNNIIVIAVTER